MVNQSREKFFQKLPKRQLQYLCRDLGIPFGHRKDLLANALAALPEHCFNLEYGNPVTSFSQADPQCDKANFDPSGVHLPRALSKSVAGYGGAHNMPRNQFEDIHAGPLAASTRKRREEYFLKFTKRQLTSLSRKIQLPHSCSKQRLAKNLAAMPEYYFDPEYRSVAGPILQCDGVGCVSDGANVPRPSNYASVSGYPGAFNISIDQFKEINIGPLPVETVNVESVSTSKEDNNYKRADACCFPPVPQCDKGGFPYYAIADKSCSQTFPQCDGGDLNCNASPKKYSKNKFILTEQVQAANMPSTQFQDVNTTKVSTAVNAGSVRVTKACLPSFEFYVRSDEGINLYVDLNSSLSKWAESLTKNVHITESTSSRPQRFQEEVVLFAENNLQSKSASSLTVDNGRGNLDQLHSGPVLSIESKENSPDVMEIDIPKGIEENQVLSVSKPDCAENQIYVVTVDPNSNDNRKMESVVGPVSKSISDGETSLVTSEQPMELIDEGCERCSVSGSEARQMSEAGNFKKDESSRDKIMSDLVDKIYNLESEQGLSTYSNEFNDGTDLNQFLMHAENEDRSGNTSGGQSSECLQIENSFDRNCLRPDDEDQNALCKLEAMDLKRPKFIPCEVLPRRSMRLVPK